MSVNMIVVLDDEPGTKSSKRPRYLVQVTTEKTEEGLSLPPSQLLKAIMVLKKYPCPHHTLMHEGIIARVEDAEEGMFFIFYSRDGGRGFASFFRLKFGEAIKMGNQALRRKVNMEHLLSGADRANRDAAVMTAIVVRDSCSTLQCDL